jgi:hypothetical protein
LTVNFVSPEGSPENGWDINPEVVPEKEALGEEYVDIEDFLGLETSTVSVRNSERILGDANGVLGEAYVCMYEVCMHSR